MTWSVFASIVYLCTVMAIDSSLFWPKRFRATHHMQRIEYTSSAPANRPNFQPGVMIFTEHGPSSIRAGRHMTNIISGRRPVRRYRRRK
ncbi:hypothetical protein GE09DRAFT_1120506 [Coniochaeta sp. 2T2.1]|nr:hypothetical protein GE09DRAFT_1120506 [Coniochaeta sp. 2T2.1]